MKSPEEESTGPVIRDLRRIDPETGQVRGTGRPGSPLRGPGSARPGKHAVSKPGGKAGGEPGTGSQEHDRPATAAGAPPGLPGDQQADDDQAASLAGLALAERTADLQRLQAEYANYRKRVERDRVAVREQALANVLGGLLPVLDDIGRAREHEELSGGFKAVAELLESAMAKLGLTSFGEDGDPFDPNLHEALMHSYSADVTEPTCVRILQPGYKIGDRILRPARVAVAEPVDQGEPGSPAGPGDPASPDTRQAADADDDDASGADGDPRASDAD
ncbi:MAG TPA: nucleotide exchange factor GrpE [Streptosporangiaceae bacterium]